jgi:hypothetical protein
LPAVLTRHPNRMLALLWKTGVVDAPGHHCNGSRFFPAKLSRYFVGDFSHSMTAACGSMEEGGIGYFACVDTTSIPARRKDHSEAPGKSGRALVAFYGPGPPLGSLTKEMQLY